MNPPCVCGCGKEVSRPWHRYLFGHFRYHDGPPNDPSKYQQRPQETWRMDDVDIYKNLVAARHYITAIRKVLNHV